MHVVCDLPLSCSLQFAGPHIRCANDKNINENACHFNKMDVVYSTLAQHQAHICDKRQISRLKSHPTLQRIQYVVLTLYSHASSQDWLSLKAISKLPINDNQYPTISQIMRPTLTCGERNSNGHVVTQSSVCYEKQHKKFWTSSVSTYVKRMRRLWICMHAALATCISLFHTQSHSSVIVGLIRMEVRETCMTSARA
jgi:hypothetical protein